MAESAPNRLASPGVTGGSSYRERERSDLDAVDTEEVVALTSDRKCQQCGGSMEGRPANARYCGSECAKEAERERRRERQRRRRRDPEWRARRKAKRREKALRKRAAAEGKRLCEDCPADISDRGPRSKRCKRCQRRWKRAIEREAYRKRMGLPEERRCAECGTSIEHRHPRAKYCEECAALREAKQKRRDMRRRRRFDPAFRERKRASWPCRKHMDALHVEQGGRCGICREPMPLEIRDTWAVNRIRPQAEGGKWEKANCQVVHHDCARRKGARWEGSMEAQVETWAPWKLNPGTK